MTADRCDGCGGPLGAGRCPLCDPRPISADRDAGCVCPARRPGPLHLDPWQPAPGCPVHRDYVRPLMDAVDVDQLFAAPQPDVVVRWDDDTRALLAALYGDAFLDQLEADATTYAREHLAAGEHTPAPGAPPVDALRGEDEQRPIDAGGPGRAHLEGDQ